MLAFLCQKKYYLFPTLVTSHTLTLFFRIDKSANSFTNISLFVIHPFFTQQIKKLPFKHNAVFVVRNIKASGPLLRKEASYFVDTFFNRENKRLAWHHRKKSYVNITKLKTIHVARCRSTCEAELTMYKILANGRKTKPSCSHNNISNAGNTESDVRTLLTYT